MSAVPNDLDAFWMPFTANRQFKANPRLFSRAEGLYYWTPDGRQVLDAASGLWCVNAGHGRKEITEAVSKQIAVMDYAPPFQMGHPIAFEFANSLVQIGKQCFAPLLAVLIEDHTLQVASSRDPADRHRSQE